MQRCDFRSYSECNCAPGTCGVQSSMTPLAQILASANRSANTGRIAFVLVAAIITLITIAAAETVGPAVI